MTDHDEMKAHRWGRLWRPLWEGPDRNGGFGEASLDFIFSTKAIDAAIEIRHRSNSPRSFSILADAFMRGFEGKPTREEERARNQT